MAPGSGSTSGPVNFQPGEAIKIVLVIFIAAYLAENRALLAGASARIGPVKIPPLPYLLPMLAIFVVVMLIVVISRDLGTALLFFGIFLTMLFVATGRRSYVLVGLILFIAGSFVAYQLFGHVARRVDSGSTRSRIPAGRATRRSSRCTPSDGAASSARASARACCRAPAAASTRSRPTSSSRRSPRSSG